MERLREKILNGELREGEQLRQDAIAAEFQISRIPVREALSHLVAEGLITIVANRGAVVSALSLEKSGNSGRRVVDPHYGSRRVFEGVYQATQGSVP